MVRQHPDVNIHHEEEYRESKQAFEEAEDDLRQEIVEKGSGTYVLRVVHSLFGEQQEFVFDAYNVDVMTLFKYKENAEVCEWIDMSDEIRS